ncbi:MAG TPA: Do family serine endopeptidase [Caulobacteraceae bacterium]|jgi:serine protease Do
MPVKKTGYLVGAIAAAGVGVAALAGVGSGWTPPHRSPEKSPLSLIKASTAPIFAPPPGAPLSFADIFDRVSPAVVSIDVTTKVDTSRLRGIPGFENFPFDIVPKGQQPNPRGGDQQTPQNQPEAMSSGSGFFISSDGYIVTNNHVVENATDIRVTLKDERELKGRVVGRDEATDLAVIKVEGRNFPFVNFENSAKPRVGDWVITVGNPFGLGGTATAGIVSAYGRDIGDTAFVNYIQIDAPINRGNSGGPTFDVYGRVIGVNSAIFSPSGGSVGIGFAIPSDVADTITKQLISGGKISRGYMGATIQNVTPEIAESLGLKGRKGALVADVTPGGPADKAGLRSGDVVLQFNGADVNGSSELTRKVGGTRSGEVMRLTVLRDGRQQQVQIRSGMRPSESELNRSANDNDNDNQGEAPEAPAAPRPSALGMTFGPLDAAAQRRYSIPADVRGVVVESVTAGTDAGRKGLRRGDVIVSANQRPTASPADLPAAVAQAKREQRPSILLQVYRQGRNTFVPIKIEP